MSQRIVSCGLDLTKAAARLLEDDSCALGLSQGCERWSRHYCLRVDKSIRQRLLRLSSLQTAATGHGGGTSYAAGPVRSYKFDMGPLNPPCAKNTSGYAARLRESSLIPLDSLHKETRQTSVFVPQSRQTLFRYMSF